MSGPAGPAAQQGWLRRLTGYCLRYRAIPALGQVGVLALGGWMAIEGQVTLGTFVAFASYLAQMAVPVRMMTVFLTACQLARARVERVMELIDGRPLVLPRPSGAAPRGSPETTPEAMVPATPTSWPPNAVNGRGSVRRRASAGEEDS